MGSEDYSSGDVVFDYEGQAEKINYSTVLLSQILRINEILSRINFTPPELYKFSAQLDDEELKPNKANFINSVDALEMTFFPYITEDIKKELEAIKQKEAEKNLVGKSTNFNIDNAKERFKLIMKAMHKKGLLPLEYLT